MIVVELRKLLRRPRTWISIALLAGLPTIVAVFLAVSDIAPRPGTGPAFLSAVLANGALFPAAALAAYVDWVGSSNRCFAPSWPRPRARGSGARWRRSRLGGLEAAPAGVADEEELVLHHATERRRSHGHVGGFKHGHLGDRLPAGIKRQAQHPLDVLVGLQVRAAPR